jgi:hypothetical protein
MRIAASSRRSAPSVPRAQVTKKRWLPVGLGVGVAGKAREL